MDTKMIIKGLQYDKKVLTELNYKSLEYIDAAIKALEKLVAMESQKTDNSVIVDVIPSVFRTWWAMHEAEWELSDTPVADDAIVLAYMGCGASCHVTAGAIRKMLSAPSHGQQSAFARDDAVLSALEKAQPFVEMARENGITGALEVEILMANVYDTVRERCPSHESEQLQTLRAHGLAENQQTEGE